MSTPFVLITTHRIKPGQLDAFRALTRDYATFVERNEPRALSQAAYLNEAEGEVSLLHLHADAASADRHLQIGREQIGQGLEISEVVGVTVYGDPGPSLRFALDENRARGVPVHVTSTGLAGFVRTELPT